MSSILWGLLWILAVLIILPATFIGVTYLNKVRSTSSSPTATTIGVRKIHTGKAVKLGLVVIALYVVKTYDWSQLWLSKELLGLIGRLPAAEQELITGILSWAPWIIAGLLVWLILTSTGTTAKTGGDYIKMTYRAFLTLLVAAVLMGAYVQFFGQPAAVHGETITFRFKKEEWKEGAVTDPQMVGIHDTIEVAVQANRKGQPILWACPEPTALGKYMPGLRYKVAGGYGTYFPKYELEPASQNELAAIPLLKYRLRYIVRSGMTDPCSF